MFSQSSENFEATYNHTFIADFPEVFMENE